MINCSSNCREEREQNIGIQRFLGILAHQFIELAKNIYELSHKYQQEERDINGFEFVADIKTIFFYMRKCKLCAAKNKRCDFGQYCIICEESSILCNKSDEWVSFREYMPAIKQIAIQTRKNASSPKMMPFFEFSYAGVQYCCFERQHDACAGVPFFKKLRYLPEFRTRGPNEADSSLRIEKKKIAYSQLQFILGLL